MSSAELHELVGDVVSRSRPGPGLWATLDELGLTRIGIPEQCGGSGGTPRELADVAEALGAHGVAVPLVERATGAWALTAAGQPLVPDATLAVVPDAAARVAPLVPWVEGAARLVLVDVAANALGLLDLAEATVRLDSTVGSTAIPLTDVLWTACPEPLPAPVTSTAVLARLALLRAATVAGAARSAYRLTRDHVRTREQFGRPLVALAPVKSALARMRVQLLQLDTALAAALDRSESAGAFPSAVAARVVAATVASEIAQLSHQLHGAIGITQEYSLHPLSRALWAARDIDLPEDSWAWMLGEHVVAHGEPALWDLTAVPASG